jgi:dTDP-4-amino-4,6-dideoxygalactose transaminase
VSKFKIITDFIRSTFQEPSEFIPLHDPRFIGNEKKYMAECIDSNFVSSVGEFVGRFEKQCAEYTGAKYAIAAMNGTSALHIALLLAGVRRDDEVITQALTFIATANAISYTGARPVFIDVDKETMGLSPSALEEWLIENAEMRGGDTSTALSASGAKGRGVDAATARKDEGAKGRGGDDTNTRQGDKARGREGKYTTTRQGEGARGREGDFATERLYDNTTTRQTENMLEHRAVVQSSGRAVSPSPTLPLSHFPYNKHTGKRISACVPMHTFGHPVKLKELKEVCDRYNIPLIEDAAESIGSYYNGKHTGTIGKLGILSFNGNKVITTGGGGMILTDDEELAKMAKHLTTQAKVPHPYEFVHDHIGYNYRMTNVSAALGCAQMESLDHLLSLKRTLAEQYKDFFKNTEFEFFEEPENCKSNYWLNAIITKDKAQRDELLLFTNKNGVMTRPIWELMNRLPMFADCQTDSLENSTWFADRVVNIPSSAIVPGYRK